MTTRRIHTSILALFAIFSGSLFSYVIAVNCTATSLMLGTLSGTLTITPTSCSYDGSCTAQFTCTTGDSSGYCNLCIKSSLLEYSDINGWTPTTRVSNNPNYTISTPASTCGNIATYNVLIRVMWSGIPRQSADETFRAMVEIAPNSPTSNCNAASYTLSSYEEIVVPKM